MPPEDDFRRDRDPLTRRRAAIMAAVVAVGLAVPALVLSLGRSSPSPQAPPPTPLALAPTLPPAPPPTPLSLSPSPIPTRPVLGSGFSAAYDVAAHRLVVFGGVDSYDLTWLWDGRRWALARPSLSPPGRFRAAVAYDPLTAMVMVYGGRLGPGQLVDDTWGWDGGSWRQLDAGTGSPPLGEDATMGWDSALDEMVLVAGGETEAKAQTWTWSALRSVWVRQAAGDLAAGTVLVGMAADPVTGVFLGVTCCSVGGGTTSTLAFDGARWHPLSTRSAPGFAVGLVRDPQSSRLLMFGDPAVDSGRDIWAWTGRDWSLVLGAQLPLFPAGAVTDSDTGHVVVVGSVAEPVQGNPQPAHVWSLNGSAWQRLD